jgi:hypothetical protein
MNNAKLITVHQSAAYSLNGIDTNSFYLTRDHLVHQIAKILENQRFIVISSSAASGKTSLLQLFASRTEKTDCTYISFLNDNHNAFDLLKSAGVDLLAKVCTLVEEKDTVYVVMLDDSQKKYDETAFWEMLIKVSPVWLPANVRFVISATYVLSASSESPVEFESLHRISRNDMLLSVDEYQIFMDSPLGLPETIRTPTIRNLLWNETGALVGAVRLSVHHIINKFQKVTRPPESEVIQYYLSYDFAKQMSRCFGNLEQLKNPRESNLKIFLEKCFLGGIHSLARSNEEKVLQLIQLEKSGILEEVGDGLRFTSPLARRFCGRWLFPNRSDESEKSKTLLELVFKTIGSMSTSLLRSSAYPSGEFPKEAVFQHLFMVALAQCTPPDCSICPELSEVFPNPETEFQIKAPVARINGEIDFYLDGKLRWGIELLIKGDRIKEHVDRFSKNGKYHALDPKDYIIIDFRPGPVSKKIRHYPKRLTVFFENDYSKCCCLYGDNDELTEITLSN